MLINTNFTDMIECLTEKEKRFQDNLQGIEFLFWSNIQTLHNYKGRTDDWKDSFVKTFRPKQIEKISEKYNKKRRTRNRTVWQKWKEKHE